MNDDVKFSIRQIDGAWRLMCAGGPKPVAAATEGIQYIFSGVPISFFNLAVLTDSNLSAGALGMRGREACAWAADQSVPWMLVVTHEHLEPGVDAVSNTGRVRPDRGDADDRDASADGRRRSHCARLAVDRAAERQRLRGDRRYQRACVRNGPGSRQEPPSVLERSGRIIFRLSAWQTASLSAAPRS